MLFIIILFILALISVSSHFNDGRFLVEEHLFALLVKVKSPVKQLQSTELI